VLRHIALNLAKPDTDGFAAAFRDFPQKLLEVFEFRDVGCTTFNGNGNY
jgi:hypothetical protein